MFKFIKKNWKKIFICMSISFSFIFSFAFIPKTFAQEENNNNGYEILPNGIQSKNLFDGILVNGYHSGSNGALSFQTGQLVTNRNLIYIGNNVDFTISFYDNNCRLDGIAYYDVNQNFLNYEQLSYQISPFTASTVYNEYYIAFNFINDNGLQYYNVNNVMINLGTTPLNYFPFGTYDGYNEYDWNNDLLQENERLKSEIDNFNNINFMDYLIGQNYFTEGKIEYRQTTNGTWWDRKLLNSNSSTNSYIGNSNINEYINGNQLNISSAYNNLLDSASSVVLGRFSEIMLFPSLSLKSTSWNYLSIEARYINIDVYAPNFSGQCRAVLSDNGLYNDETSPNLSIVEFTKNGDYFNIRFDSDNLNYLCYIEFSLPYNSSSQRYQVPNYAISNIKDTTAWNLYNLGYDDGYNVQRGEIEGLKSNLEAANSSVNVLKQRVNDLQEQVNNNFGFKNVFFAMADTPFKTVSNFLGFELFGINLFQALIGFITVLACIWLIKKLI